MLRKVPARCGGRQKTSPISTKSLSLVGALEIAFFLTSSRSPLSNRRYLGTQLTTDRAVKLIRKIFFRKFLYIGGGNKVLVPSFLA